MRSFKLYSALIFVLLVGSTFATIAIEPQNADEAAAYFRHGKLLYAKGDVSGAIESFTKSIEIKPGWADAYVQRGIARRMHGELDKALEDFDKAGEIDPRAIENNGAVAQAYTNHGQILATRFQLNEAIQDFDKAIKLFGGDVRPYYERAQARLLLEDFKGALLDYDSYISKEKYDPFGRSRGYLERGLTKQLLGRDAEAKEDMEQGMKLAGKDANALLQALDFLKSRLDVMRQLNAQKRNRIG